MSYMLTQKNRMHLDEPLFQEESKRKLHCLSASYIELARMYEEDAKKQFHFENRKDYLLKRRLEEEKRIFSKQLQEISGAVCDVADTMLQVSIPTNHKRKLLIQYLKKQGILVKEMLYINTPDAQRRLRIVARGMGKRQYTTKDIADLLSVFFDRRLVPCMESEHFLKKGFGTFLFQDEPRYSIMHAIARRTKDGEELSGDNYSIDEYTDGNMTYMISDGCGSGRKAYCDSQAVLEFMERFLEAGFTEEKAFHMVNAALAARTEITELTTLDLCTIHLHTGEAEFLKAGAASSYCKRGNKVQEITCDALPLGSFSGLSPMTQSIQLMDQDMIVMLSDGVTDCFDCRNGYNRIRDVIGSFSTTNPKELCEYILQYAKNCQGGQVLDDMTVMAVGVWT